MTTPSIPGVDRDALIEAIWRDAPWTVGEVAHAALAYIAAHHECTCDREHADEWVEVDSGGTVLRGLPEGARVRSEWAMGIEDSTRLFVHRDDLPDDPRALIARELGPARADTFLGLLDEYGWTVTRKGER